MGVLNTAGSWLGLARGMIGPGARPAQSLGAQHSSV